MVISRFYLKCLLIIIKPKKYIFTLTSPIPHSSPRISLLLSPSIFNQPPLPPPPLYPT
ncbi:hypothetical protein HanXRQr2_Chr17g0810811 [Helianthus annuus]|uniref:Uncharacterized protein n=1 Tax=Helianthus annuus TaxID=4232 RepID=A0A251RRG0_HELAN|nr:hypothetical protein HanXRQr2_Chr17g0810811 [Helianthus annuus]KAJ0434291.1 hypothetical protein HanIR_Chr17g0879901 [Helianthus annuus]